MTRVYAVLSLWLLLTACTAVQFGHEFDPGKFESHVEHGVTTREAVRGWLGEPNSRGMSMNEKGERLEEWVYFHGRGNLPNMQDAKLRILQIRFNAQGRVASYSWTGERKK